MSKRRYHRRSKMKRRGVKNGSLHGSKMAPKWFQNGSQIGPGGLLEGSWRSLGALKKAWSAKGGLPGAYGSLLEASRGARGKALERLLATQRQFSQDKFQPSWGQTAAQREPEVQNRTREGAPTESAQPPNLMLVFRKFVDV